MITHNEDSNTNDCTYGGVSKGDNFDGDCDDDGVDDGNDCGLNMLY